MRSDVIQLRSSLSVAEIAHLFREALSGRRVEFGKIKNEDDPFVINEDDPFVIVATLPGVCLVYACCMQTSVRVSRENRDALAQIAKEDLGGVSLDEALRILVFEHHTQRALTRLDRQGGLDAYRQEARTLADTDTDVLD